MVEINLTEPFKATLDGRKISVRDMGEIAQYYQARGYAEYFYENYKLTMECAIDLGYEVIRQLNKYNGTTEENAIDIVVKKYALEER